MYEFVWKLLVWPAAILCGGVTGLDATLWSGDDGVTDRVMGGIVLGFLAAALWLMISTTIRALATRRAGRRGA